MNNSEMTKKERNLLKGAIRRVFSRSDLRRHVINTIKIQYEDINRKRVKNWSLCPLCIKPIPTYMIVVDHIDPIIPINISLEDMTWDQVIDRTWCSKNNLQPICVDCHKEKTKMERKLRKESKK